MADFTAYHALGHDATGQPSDPRFPRSPGQNAPPELRPQVFASPAGYQHSGLPQDVAHATSQQQYGMSPQPGYGTQEMGYFPQQGHDGVGGLTAQMGGLGVSDAAGAAPARTHQRKDRHAYHDISQPPG